MESPAYKRILLKISGEALAAGQGFGVDNQRVHEIAAELAEVHSLGIEIAIVDYKVESLRATWNIDRLVSGFRIRTKRSVVAVRQRAVNRRVTGDNLERAEELIGGNSRWRRGRN